MGLTLRTLLLEGDETMKTISRETLRAALRAKFGSGNYRLYYEPRAPADWLGTRWEGEPC